MTTAINALSGVQWTELDGVVTTDDEKSTVQGSIKEITKFLDLFEPMLELLGSDRNISWNDLTSLGNNYVMDWYDNETGKANYKAPGAHAICVGEEAARKMLASLPNSSAVTMLNARGQVQFVTKDHSGAISVLPVLDGRGLQIDRWTLTHLGYTHENIKAGTSNPFNSAMSIGRLNELTGMSINASQPLDRNKWQLIINKLKELSYKDASKLSAADGGGLKTYNGKWYANGQELSYLDITFAVRINQLFVINNTVTDYLSMLQKNNIKIKNANAIAAVISAQAPAGSSGSVNISDIKHKLLGVALNAGLIPSEKHFASHSEARKYLAAGPLEGKALFRDTDGTYKWLHKTTTSRIPFYATHPLEGFGMDFSKVIEMFPQSITKLLNSAQNCFKESGTLSQNDCTTIVTELKSYTTSVESSSQVAQTQLDQYNNKRTEVLDNISNIIKGNNTTLSSVAKNLGAL